MDPGFMSMGMSLKPCTTTTSNLGDNLAEGQSHRGKPLDSGFVDLSLKPCTTIPKLVEVVQSHRDRLSRLPNELLIRIFSLLPTKYVVVMCVLLKKKKSEVLPWITSLDFDDSPICHCLRLPHEIHRFPSFVSFVDSVLQSHKSQCLTRFTLRVGVDSYKLCHPRCIGPELGGHRDGCLPDLKSTQIDAWISFPLTRCGLRELNLRIFSREPRQLPPEIFSYETLEVLKLEVNLSLDGVSTFHLPNLKTFRLYASLISEDSFLTRLVSSCPLLEELDVEAWWNHVSFTNITSPSLRRLSLSMLKLELEEIDNSDLLLLDTPNLEYLEYNDNVASQYSITNMASLVEAKIIVQHMLATEPIEISCQQLLVFIRALSNVSYLSLFGNCFQVLNYIEGENQLPVFHNLKRLELHEYGIGSWNKILVAFLYCSPNLETLGFPEGIHCELSRMPDSELEREFMCRTTLAEIPLCCRFNLKRIEIKRYQGSEREINLIQFLLRHCFVLEELVISCFRGPIADETTLQNLPRASLTCSIQVQ